MGTMKIDAIEVGRRIAKLRRDAGHHHHKDFAKLLDQSDETVRRWEAGKTVPPWQQVSRMADIFKVPEDVILFGERPQQPILTYILPTEQEVLALFRRTNKNGKDALLATLKGIADAYPNPEVVEPKLKSVK